MPREKDPLTKLFTQTYLKEDLPDELNRAKRFGRDLGLMLLEPKIPEAIQLDMAYPVLKKLALLCREVTRQVDEGVRLGNQILLVLPETSADGVQKLEEKLDESFREESFTHPTSGETFWGEFYRSHLVFPNQEGSPNDLLNNLKEKLAESKNGG